MFILKMYNFPDYILNNRDFLEEITRTKSVNKIKNFIDKATPEQIFAIYEIIFNILDGRYALKNSQRYNLSKHADFYRYVKKARTEKSIRDRLQQGGQLGAISAIIAPVIGAIAQHILERRLSKINE